MVKLTLEVLQSGQSGPSGISCQCNFGHFSGSEPGTDFVRFSRQQGAASMLKRILLVVLLTGSMGMMLTGCGAPEVETEEVDDD
jgi:hypothetical protein